MRVLRTLVILSALVVLGGACSDDKSDQAAGTATTASTAPSGPQKYTVVVDGPSTLGAENIAFGAFFPKKLIARPGDTIAFDNRGVSDIHTVTFGVKSDRSDQPAVVLKNGQINPVVFKPCFTTEPVKPDMTSCPPPVAGTPEFTGKGLWNSGIFLPTSAPAEAGPKSVTAKLAPDIPPGSYVLTCLLHRFMEGALQVTGSDTDRLSPAQVAAAADRELGEAKGRVTGIAEPTQAPVANGATVTAGWGDKLIGVNRFSPETVSVKIGQTVTWRDVSSWLPHTVSFQPPFKNGEEPDAMLPLGVKAGGKFAGGVAHSGVFGPKPPFPTDSFSLVFTKPGKYPYLCLLHPGMAGTVQVG
ncbi:MAG TPA: plastocyanin/azurin family copper-binding protein [Acidimicrobiia bacterium]|jgi:plastocyanin|nr:plastocyanin/azurin family copper-binding protein [Acidimicrobiia bacterium]